MNLGGYKFETTSSETLSAQIASKGSFIVECATKAQYNRAIDWLESEIERQEMSVRIYTRNRAAAIGAVAGGWIPGVGQILAVTALATGVGIAAHNLVTINPDWEIGKDKLDLTLYVDYKK